MKNDREDLGCEHFCEFIHLFVQVTLLHGALEQERSKVKGLQTEQPKHQVRVQ